MDPSQSQTDDIIDDERTNPKIGLNITPCEDLRSSASDLSSEHSQSPSKCKLPISIMDLWRIRRKEKLKKRFLSKSLRLANDDGDDDSDSYSFDHDSLATPSINTSQIDPSMDSDNDNEDFSWSSNNSPGGSRSSSMDSASPEASWGPPPYGNMQQHSHGSSEDPLSQVESSRRASVCTVIDRHSSSRESVLMSNPKETVFNIDTTDKQLKSKGSEGICNSEGSSDSNSKISECTVDENEEFKQIMKNMTIASFSNKKINSYDGSDESIEEPEEQVRTLSNILDPIDLLTRNSIISIDDNLPTSILENISVSSKSEILNTGYTNEIEEKDDVEHALPSVVSKRDIDKLKSSEGNDRYEDKIIDNKYKNLSTKENAKLALNKKESENNGKDTNKKGNHRTENNSKNNKFNSNHAKRSITQSLEFKRIEKTVGLGIDKSCFWCCEIL